MAGSAHDHTGSPARDGRLPLLLLGLMFLPTALQATLAPRSFFDDFPLGRGWVAADGGAYNEHLVRDVGGLFLALVILSLVAWIRPSLCFPVGLAWLVQGLLHLVFHAGHLEGLEAVDSVGLVSSLVLVPVLATWAIVTGRRLFSGDA